MMIWPSPPVNGVICSDTPASIELLVPESSVTGIFRYCCLPMKIVACFPLTVAMRGFARTRAR